MTIRQIIANFWCQLEQETGVIPTRIELPPVAYDQLASEFAAKAKVATATLARRGERPVLVLTHGSQRIRITRASDT